nr:hypothetical protein [Tanacetum cinerariifolium]GEX78428.1 hypothetical protein [Tanacetum cinerariifolium]
IHYLLTSHSEIVDIEQVAVSSSTKVFTMKIEILLEPTSNKLLRTESSISDVFHGEFPVVETSKNEALSEEFDPKEYDKNASESEIINILTGQVLCDKYVGGFYECESSKLYYTDFKEYPSSSMTQLLQAAEYVEFDFDNPENDSLSDMVKTGEEEIHLDGLEIVDDPLVQTLNKQNYEEMSMYVNEVNVVNENQPHSSEKLRARKKFGFVNGTIKQPNDKSPDLKDWWTNNSLIASWIMNTIESLLRSTISHIEVAEDISKDIKERFAMANGPRIHQLKAKLANGFAFAKRRKDEKVHQFLMRLDETLYEAVRSNLLAQDPLPNLNKIYSTLVQEECVKTVVSAKEKRGEVMSFVVNTVPRSYGRGDRKEENKRTNCNRSRHESSRYFEIIRYPKWWNERPRRSGQAAGRNKGGCGGRLKANAVQSSTSGAPRNDNIMNAAKIGANENLTAVTLGFKPQTFKEAIKDEKRRSSMQKEIQALENNGTWIVTTHPVGKKVIGSKWVYKIKYHLDGSVERYKARLVILGDNQVEGLDYNETFTPVSKMVTVRTFLAVASAKNYDIHQMDAHNAFLHGNIEEEVHVNVLVYVNDLIILGNDEADLLGAKPTDLPLKQNNQLPLANGKPLVDPEPYHILVGRLIYLSVTRHDLSYCVHMLAQVMQSPLQEHWDAALRVVHY